MEKAVLYKPQCNSIGCVGISKIRRDDLKNCGLYWNTILLGGYKRATTLDMTFQLYVSGRSVYGPQHYGHLQNGDNKPRLFHGEWGLWNGDRPWGQYGYTCDVFFSCTGYLKASDEVTVDGWGSGYLGGQLGWTSFHGDWKAGKGQVVLPWRGAYRWGGLPKNLSMATSRRTGPDVVGSSGSIRFCGP
jgi:hypothetical protein